MHTFKEQLWGDTSASFPDAATQTSTPRSNLTIFSFRKENNCQNSAPFGSFFHAAAAPNQKHAAFLCGCAEWHWQLTATWSTPCFWVGQHPQNYLEQREYFWLCLALNRELLILGDEDFLSTLLHLKWRFKWKKKLFLKASLQCWWSSPLPELTALKLEMPGAPWSTGMEPSLSLAETTRWRQWSQSFVQPYPHRAPPAPAVLGAQVGRSSSPTPLQINSLHTKKKKRVCLGFVSRLKVIIVACMHIFNRCCIPLVFIVHSTRSH